MTVILRIGRNIKVGNTSSGGTSSSGNTSKVVTVTATFTTAPVNPTASFTELLYDKKLAICLTKDDSGIGDFNVVYPVISGGVAADNVNYPGKAYTDGTGKARKIGYSFAVIAGVLDGANSQQTSAAQYANIFASDNFYPTNHTYAHGGADGGALFQTQKGRTTVKNILGLDMRTITIPTGEPGFVQAGVTDNDLLVLSQGFGNNPASSDPAQSSADGYSANLMYGSIAVDAIPDKYITTANGSKMLAVSRENLDGGWAADGIESIAKAYINSCFTNSANYPAKKFIYRAFSHGPNSAAEAAYFEQLLAYSQTHPSNGDSVWWANAQEWPEYLELKRLAIKSAPVVSGNTVSFQIDLSALPDVSHYQNMSFKVTGGTLQSVTVTGAEDKTFNPSTGLVNIYKKDFKTV